MHANVEFARANRSERDDGVCGSLIDLRISIRFRFDLVSFRFFYARAR